MRSIEGTDRSRAAIVGVLLRAAIVHGFDSLDPPDAGVDVTSPTRRALLDALAVAHNHYTRDRAVLVATTLAHTVIAVGTLAVGALLWRRFGVPGVLSFWVWLVVLLRSVGAATACVVRVRDLVSAYYRLVRFILEAAAVGFEKMN